MYKRQVSIRRGILVLVLLLVILLTGEEVPYFLPRIIVHGPTERRTISLSLIHIYKKNMFALLNKPGYEEESKAIQARL